MNKQKQFRFYERMEFDDEQLNEIKKGVEDGLDVSVYARLTMPAEEMAHVRKSMNFKRSLSSVVQETSDIDTSNIEDKIEAKSKEEKVADAAIFLGETSIVASVIVVLLVLLRII